MRDEDGGGGLGRRERAKQGDGLVIVAERRDAANQGRELGDARAEHVGETVLGEPGGEVAEESVR